MSSFLQVSKLKKVFVILITLLGGFSCYAQKSIDFGLGTSVSIGFQNEWALQLKSQYHFQEKWALYADYNLYFRRDVEAQNTEKYHEFGLGANYKIISFSNIDLYGGAGYLVNNFPIQNNNPDTSNLYFTTGSLNHSAQLKLAGTYPLGKKTLIYSELNIKSLGRRYDTFAFGLIYRLAN